MVTCPRVVRCGWRPWLAMIGLAILKVKSKRGVLAKQVRLDLAGLFSVT